MKVSLLTKLPFLLPVCLAASLFCGLAKTTVAQTTPVEKEFLYGASVYPELQTREEWNRMLDEFREAGINCVRVSESSWGNLETAPGKYNFGWLHQFLDDLHKRGMKAVLGTSSYLPPQWLTAANPTLLQEFRSGGKLHPMGRHAASLHHPQFRAAVNRYVTALAREFKDHPAVIGWQIDNEVEWRMRMIDYNPVTEEAWTKWLSLNYRSAAEINRRWGLVGWGLKVDSLDLIPQFRVSADGNLAIVKLAHLRFTKDSILDYFRAQKDALRLGGAKQWITTDWVQIWNTIADEPAARQILDISGCNSYPPSAPDPEFYRNAAWHYDLHRSVYGAGRFILTETRIGVAGDVKMFDAFPSQRQFNMWMLHPVAFGASGLWYWSGNRWVNGHWPHWGGLLDWTGQPEPDFKWVAELGRFFSKWGKTLIEQPVKAEAAIITDFDQRAALDVYPHTNSSQRVLSESFDLMHRLGLGVDCLTTSDATDVKKISRYRMILIPAATALDREGIETALQQYIESGGQVVITPFTAYQLWDGVFRSDGFGANLKNLTGAFARTVRRMGTTADEGRENQRVAWKEAVGSEISPVGIDGFCELLEVARSAEVIATFQSDEPFLNGKPAAVRRKIGKGAIIKLGFWPGDDSLAGIIRRLLPADVFPLLEIAPAGVMVVPRSDGSVFVVNTSSKPAKVRLKRDLTDRISGKKVSSSAELSGYEVLWLD